MTTHEEHDPVARKVRPQPERTGPLRGASAAAAPVPDEGLTEPETLVVNEAVAQTVRTAYDVLGDTVKQGRKAAEQFRVGAYNVRDVPDDMRVMAGNLLGLARQLSSATLDICEALLRKPDTLMTPPPPGSTPVPPFLEVKAEHAARHAAHHGSHQHGSHHHAPYPGSHPIAAPAPPLIALEVLFNGKEPVRAHTAALARPEAPTGAEQIGCDGLARRGGEAAPITDVVFDVNPHGPGLRVMVTVPQDQPAGIYSGAIYCSTQPLPLGQLVIEVD